MCVICMHPLIIIYFIEIWRETEEEIDIMVEEATLNSNPKATTEYYLVVTVVMFLLRLQSKYYITDAAITSILKFLYIIFVILGRFSDVSKAMSEIIPHNIYSLKKFIGINNTFEKLVVCPECNSVYNKENCIARPGISKLCSFKAFHRARSCSVPLLKTVELASRKKILYPIKVYCHQSVTASLKKLLSQPHFYQYCEQWRSRSIAPGVLNDIYDGSLWNDFMQHNSEPFLIQPGSIALSLNVDWFQPYKLTQSSVGVIFFTILNLPRSIRYKQQNTILAGIIPGPHEPKRDINSFLDPIVKELIDLWNGVEMNVHSFPNPQKIKCALLCVTCDLPAGKKVAGFLGHMA